MIFDGYTFGHLKIAEIQWIKDDGGSHGETRPPGSNLSDLPNEVAAEIALAWTPAVIAAWQQYMAANTPPAPVPLTKDQKIDAVVEVGLLALFNHENRIRALEAKPAITLAQFKTGLKALLSDS